MWLIAPRVSASGGQNTLKCVKFFKGHTHQESTYISSISIYKTESGARRRRALRAHISGGPVEPDQAGFHRSIDLRERGTIQRSDVVYLSLSLCLLYILLTNANYILHRRCDGNEPKIGHHRQCVLVRDLFYIFYFLRARVCWFLEWNAAGADDEETKTRFFYLIEKKRKEKQVFCSIIWNI